MDVSATLLWSVLVAVTTSAGSFLVASFRLGKEKRTLDEKIETIEKLTGRIDKLDRIVRGDADDMQDSRLRHGLVGRVDQVESAYRPVSEAVSLVRSLRRVLKISGSSGEHQIEEQIRAGLAKIMDSGDGSDGGGSGISGTRKSDSGKRYQPSPWFPPHDDTPPTDPQVPRPPRPSEGEIMVDEEGRPARLDDDGRPLRGRIVTIPVAEHLRALREGEHATVTRVEKTAPRRYQTDKHGAPLSSPLTNLPPPPPYPSRIVDGSGGGRVTRQLPHDSRHTTGGMPVYVPGRDGPGLPPRKKEGDDDGE